TDGSRSCPGPAYQYCRFESGGVEVIQKTERRPSQNPFPAEGSERAPPAVPQTFQRDYPHSPFDEVDDRVAGIGRELRLDPDAVQKYQSRRPLRRERLEHVRPDDTADRLYRR